MEELKQALSKYGYTVELSLSSGEHGACYLIRKNNISYIIKDYKYHDALESAHEAEVYNSLHGEGFGSEFFFKVERIKFDNKYYLVSQTYEGETLESYIKQNQLLTLSDKLDILINVCKAIREMHQSKPSYLHLDIKPSNLYLSHINKSVKPIDMGSAIVKKGPKVFQEIMTSNGYMSTNAYASMKVRIFNDLRNEYKNFEIIQDKNVEYMLSNSEKEYLCNLESKICIKDDIYSLICCIFYTLTNGKHFKFWIDTNYNDYDDYFEIFKVLEENDIPQYIINRLTELFMYLNEPYVDPEKEVPFNSVDELIYELEILRDIELNYGFHPEILLRNSFRYYENYFSNLEIKPELITDIKEGELI